MAEPTVKYEGTVDIGSVLGQISAAMPNSPLIRDFFKDIAQPLIEQLKGAKIKGLTIDLSSIFGIDSQLTKTVKKDFAKATQRLLKAVQNQIGKVNDIKISTDFDLNKIIGATPAFTKRTAYTYQSIVQRYLKRVRTKLATANMDLAKIDLRSLIGSTPIFSRNTRLTYQALVRSILSNLQKGAASLNLSGHVDIATLIGSTPAYSLRTRMNYRDLVSRVFSRLGNELKQVKFSTEGLHLAQLLGQTPELSLWTRIKYRGIISDIFSRIRRDLDNTFKNFSPLHKGPITLAELIGTTPQFDALSRFRYSRLIDSVFGQLKKQLSKVTLSSADVKVSELLGQSPQMDWISKWKYGMLIDSVLSNLKRQTSKINVLNTDFDLSSILGNTPQMGLIARWKYRRLVDKTIDQLSSQLSKINLQATTFSLPNILGNTPQAGLITRWKYQGMVNKLFGVIKAQLNKVRVINTDFDLTKLFGVKDLTLWSRMKFRSAINKLLAQLGNVKFAGLDLSSTFKSDLEEVPEVSVTDFSDNALKKLKTIFHGIGSAASSDPGSAPKKTEKKSSGVIDAIEGNLVAGALKRFLPGFAIGLGYTSIAALMAGNIWMMTEMGKWKKDWGNTKEEIQKREKLIKELEDKKVPKEVAKKIIQGKELVEHQEQIMKDPSTITGHEDKKSMDYAMLLNQKMIEHQKEMSNSQANKIINSWDSKLSKFFDSVGEVIEDLIFPKMTLKPVAPKVEATIKPKDLDILTDYGQYLQDKRETDDAYEKNRQLIKSVFGEPDNPMKKVAQVIRTGQDKQVKYLESLNIGINQMITHLSGAGRSLNTIAANSVTTPSSNVINNIAQGNSNGINLNLRDPAYEMRSKIWGKFREGAIV